MPAEGWTAAVGALFVALLVLVLKWLVEVRSVLATHRAELSAIQGWITRHEATVERQVAIFTEFQNRSAAMDAKLDGLLARVDRLSERVARSLADGDR